uniref:SGNH hydrolase-type esterase domain-containing protein n=1 Tax=Knipowitschia caucasica TaxID=637954 RepID=A0AAV2LL87_KNICA
MPSVHIVEGPTIWIIGDSYVRRGRDRAAETLGHNLGMAAHVQWFGRGGLRWSSLVPWLFRLLRGRSAPAVLLICCGSNDLGKVKSVDLVAAMKRDLLDLHRRYPSMDIFFSQLTDRRLWRDAQPGRINRFRSGPCTRVRGPCTRVRGPCARPLHPCARPLHPCTRPLREAPAPVCEAPAPVCEAPAPVCEAPAPV